MDVAEHRSSLGAATGWRQLCFRTQMARTLDTLTTQLPDVYSGDCGTLARLESERLLFARVVLVTEGQSATSHFVHRICRPNSKDVTLCREHICTVDRN